MLHVAVCIAYRCHDEHRARAHAYTTAWWRDAGFEVFEAEGPRTGLFSVSAAFNAAAVAAGDWDVAIFTGADIVLEDPGPAWRAAEEAYRTGRLVHPAERFGRLSEAAAAEVYAGRAPSYELADDRPNKPFRGMKTVTRRLFDKVGGHDEGFVGYHGEDLAFNIACRTVSGEVWLPGYAVHLYHDTQRRTAEHASVKRNAERLRRYYAARGKPEKMLALLGSLREDS
jgi:hypothetical protein